MLGVCYLYNYLVVGKGWEIRDSFWSRNPCQRRAHAFVDSRYHATRKNRIWVRSLYEAGCQRFLLSFFVSLFGSLTARRARHLFPRRRHNGIKQSSLQA